MGVTAVVAGGAGCSQPDASAEPLKVAAASDLAIAFKEIGDAFEKRTGKKVVFSFGSTGLLSKQIKEGAPFDLFAAANVSFVDDLVAAGSADGETKAIYGRGRIVVFTKEGVAKVEKLEQLKEPRFTKIAIANPEHAPYGKAAQQALTKLGLWDELKPRLVYGENVQQALQFAESGNADAAIVALSLALHAKGAYLTVEQELFEPIDQAMAVCAISKQKQVAKDFIAFVNSPDGRAMMTSHGFLLPGEALSQK